jgi:hypothetical protein
MKLPALFALVACLTAAATYFGSTAFGSDTPATQSPTAAHTRDSTPTAAQFARALTGATNQFGGGRSITNTHCVKGSPGRYMCAYTVVKTSGHECHLMQGTWTPGEASTITVTLAGRTDRCDSVRDAIMSLR